MDFQEQKAYQEGNALHRVCVKSMPNIRSYNIIDIIMYMYIIISHLPQQVTINLQASVIVAG